MQLTQILSKDEVIHQCADIVITEKRTDEYVSDCVGKCKNGGVCQNGQCVCREGFGGEFCLEESKYNSLLTDYRFLQCLPILEEATFWHLSLSP